MLTTYALQTVQPLKVLFQQDQLEQIPMFKLKPNSDLHLITANVASLAVTQNASEDKAKQIADIFDAIANHVQDTRNLTRLQAIEYASKNFAIILENSYSTINDISVIVDDIRKKIMERYIELMRREKAEALLPEGTTTEPKESDYQFLVWGNIVSPLRRNEIIEAACTNANLSKHDLSLMNYGYITRKLAFVDGYNTPAIPENVNADIVEKLSAVFVNDSYAITAERVKAYWLTISSAANYASGCANMAQLVLDPKNIATNCMFIAQLVSDFEIMNEMALRLISEDVSAETMSMLAANTEALKKSIYALQYWLLFNRETRFANKLILTQTIINRPVYEEFLQSGGNITKVHNYLKAFHYDSTIPVDGISVTMVASADTEERLAKAAEKLRYSEMVIKSKCLISAYESTMAKFIIDTVTVEKFPQAKEKAFVASFVNSASAKSSLLAGKTENLDKILYDVVINTLYNNGLIATMYKYLNRNFIDLANNTDGDIADDAIVKSQCFATVDMLVDYLFDQLVVE